MNIQVEAYRWDGRLKYCWPGTILERSQSELIVQGIFTREFHTSYHHFMPGDITREIYPLDAWYNICEIYGKENTLQGIYCNLAAPPTLSGNTLSYVDLVLDLYVSARGDILVLDEEEFEHLAATQMPRDMLQQARESWQELLDDLERQSGYFKTLEG